MCELVPFSAVSLLKDLKHSNIVTLHDIIHTDQALTLIFEYVVMKRDLCVPYDAVTQSYKIIFAPVGSRPQTIHGPM